MHPVRFYSSPAPRIQAHTFQCSVCLAMVRNQRELRRHMKEKHPPTIDCPVCSIPKASKRELRKHMSKEHGGAPSSSKCPICSTSIQNMRELQTHMKQEHPDHAKDSCNVCGKFFFNSGKFRVFFSGCFLNLTQRFVFVGWLSLTKPQVKLCCFTSYVRDMLCLPR